MDATATIGYYRCYSSTMQCYYSATVGPPEFADDWIPSISGLTRLLPAFIPLSLEGLSLQLYQQHLHLVIFLLSCNISIPFHHSPFYSYSYSYLFPAPPIIISQDLPRRTTCNFLSFPKCQSYPSHIFDTSSTSHNISIVQLPIKSVVHTQNLPIHHIYHPLHRPFLP